MISIHLFSQISITGEIRPRAEFRYGYRTLRSDNSDPAFFVSQRSRLNLSYTGEKYSAFIALQDVRVWGDEQYNTDTPALALHEAYVKFNLIKNLSAKLGRQCIGYDNNRIFGKANWNQSSKKHDALLLNYSNNGWDIDFTNAFNQLTENTNGTDYTDGNGNYKYLSYLWATKKTEKISISGMAMADGFQYAVDTVYTRLTYGAIVKYASGDLSFNVRYFGQGGKLVSGKEIASSLINIEAGYIIGKINLIAGMEISSGVDSNSSDSKSHAFETPYGAKHWVNGTMDYFKKTSDTKGTGLVDGYLKFSQKLSDKSSILADYHYFSTNKTYYSEGTAVSKYLASEIDLVYRHTMAKDMNLECGYSVLKGSSTLALMKSGNADKLNHWMYIMLTFKPTFFKN